MAEKYFIPLESNPDVMTAFAEKLGGNMQDFAFTDVWGLDAELLSMVPEPVLAVILLFPISGPEARPEVKGTPIEAGSAPYYMKQTIGNACGTIALLHALINAHPAIGFVAGSFLDRFFTQSQTLDPKARGGLLQNPPSANLDIEEYHKEAALAGATAAPAATDNVDLHFVTFVHSNGLLYELDGRQRGPIEHGATTPETLLQDAARAIETAYVARSDDLNFSVIALAGRMA